MPVDIYNKNFQNWLKGVFGLSTTRSVLCQYIIDQLNEDLKDIPVSELKQFFRCLCSNKIFQLKTARKIPRTWECKHEKCKILMERFVHNHTEFGVLKFEWSKSSYESIDNPDLENVDIDVKWEVVKLYMYVEKEEAVVNYNSIECLDISHATKVIRNCKVLSPDGSAEPCERVLNLRNKLMHSPDNLMDEKGTQEIFEWTRRLLDCLDIAEKTYYKKAIEELQTYAERDFVVKYQSEENKKIIDKILEAKKVADKLVNSIEGANQLHNCKRLQDMLGSITGCGLKGNNVLEMKPADYKLMVKKSLEDKSETIASDIAECDENSDEIKELENLKQHTEKVIEDVEEVIQTKETEEMIDVINSLNQELEYKKAEEIRLKKISEESTVKLEKLSNRLESIEQEKILMANEVEEYKKQNEILKEKTTSLSEENCNEPQLQELNLTWPAHSVPIEEKSQCEGQNDDLDFTLADDTLNENPDEEDLDSDQIEQDHQQQQQRQAHHHQPWQRRHRRRHRRRRRR
ncbi:ERC protein 2-like [Ruditapes philippinarum]|uniref:ERC protein 2-like n=1 Tax=Ruditapes philippinarum TaxID=129788 RepID=UPI00295AB276|nr:ERC protein 2-like [Ruditapes philippinarum]